MSSDLEVEAMPSTRRDFLKTAGVAGAIVAGGLPVWAKPAGAFARLTTKPLKIGFFNAFTGFLALAGLDTRRGFDLYLKSRGGKLGGRSVEVIYEDDAGNPAQSLAKVRKLTEQDKVAVVVGGINAASGPPVFDYVNAVGMPWVNSLIATDDLTQRLADKNRYMIRIGAEASLASHYFAEWLRQNRKDIKTVAAIGWDFLLGYEAIGGFQDVFQRMGGKVIQKLWAPIGAPDFSPFLSRLDTSADAVYAVFGAIDAVRFLTQYQGLGFKDKLPLLGAWVLTEENVLSVASLPPAAVEGVITAGHYSAVLDTPQNRDFQRRYNAEVKNAAASSTACDGWISAQAIEAALRRRNGDTSNRRKFMEAFVGLKLKTPRGDVKIEQDRSNLTSVYIRRVDKAGSKVPPGYGIPFQQTVLKTVPNASQFWRFQKKGYLARPPYSRDYPPVKK